MKITEVADGMSVKVSAHPDAQVYTIKELQGFMAHLQYITEAGHIVSGGWVDISLLKRA